jgi:hypothetical protein
MICSICNKLDIKYVLPCFHIFCDCLDNFIKIQGLNCPICFNSFEEFYFFDETLKSYCFSCGLQMNQNNNFFCRECKHLFCGKCYHDPNYESTTVTSFLNEQLYKLLIFSEINSSCLQHLEFRKKIIHFETNEILTIVDKKPKLALKFYVNDNLFNYHSQCLTFIDNAIKNNKNFHILMKRLLQLKENGFFNEIYFRFHLWLIEQINALSKCSISLTGPYCDKEPFLIETQTENKQIF